ncbi:MAG: phage holin family protein [Salinivirgaceae bacterium]
MQQIIDSLSTFINNSYAFLVGIATSVIGYFLPVRDIVHLLILFFMLDVIFGYWAAKKLRGERFSVKIIWRYTMPRMLISLVLILGAFMWDTVYCQEFISTYKIIGWFISGVLLYSIAQNGYKITKWSVFPKIGNIFSDKTGVNLKNDEHRTNK